MVRESSPEDGEDQDLPQSLPMGGTDFLTARSEMTRQVQIMRRGRCRRRMSALTRMNSYRLSRREQLGRLLELAFSLWTTATQVSKHNWHTGQDWMANCRCRTSHRESRAPRHAGGTFHRKWRSRREQLDLRGCQGWKPLVHLGLPSLRCSKNSGI